MERITMKDLPRNSLQPLESAYPLLHSMLRHKERRYATPPRGAYRLFLLSSPPAVLVEQKSAWDWCGIFI